MAAARPRRRRWRTARSRSPTRRIWSIDTVEYPVQVNGKVRGRITVPADADADSARGGGAGRREGAGLPGRRDAEEGDRGGRPAGQPRRLEPPSDFRRAYRRRPTTSAPKSPTEWNRARCCGASHVGVLNDRTSRSRWRHHARPSAARRARSSRRFSVGCGRGTGVDVPGASTSSTTANSPTAARIRAAVCGARRRAQLPAVLPPHGGTDSRCSPPGRRRVSPSRGTGFARDRGQPPVRRASARV